MEPRAHTFFQRPRRHYRLSRPAPMIVRGTATAVKQSRPVHLALPHSGPARSSDVERSAATNEVAEAECSDPRSGATPASAAATGAVIPRRFIRQCNSGAEIVAPTAAETKGSSLHNREERDGVKFGTPRTVPLTVKLSGRTQASDRSRGRILFSRARGDTTERHGPLQRWLEVTLTDHHCARAAPRRQPKPTYPQS